MLYRYVVCVALGLMALLAEAHEQRVVSLGGDITSIIYALGVQDQLVGVDLTSTSPEQAKQLPNVGYIRQLNTEGLLTLRPTHIVANSDAGPPSVIEQVKSMGINIHIMPADYSVTGLLKKVQTIGRLLNKEQGVQALVDDLQAQAVSLASKVNAMSCQPKLAFILSARGSLIVAGRGTAAHAVIDLVGGENIATDFSGYKPLVFESLVQQKPDALILMSVEDHAVSDLSAEPTIKLTPAYQNQQIFTVDGEKLLSFGADSLDHALQLQEKLLGVCQL